MAGAVRAMPAAQARGTADVTVDKDVWAGLFFMGLAVAGLYIGTDYAFGTPARMGAGFLPKLLCWCMLGIGGIVTLVGLVRGQHGEPMEAWAWGPLLAILAAVLLFGAALETIGLELAILGAVMLGGVADPSPSRFEKICLVVASIGLSLFLWPGALAVFVKWTGNAIIPQATVAVSAAATVLAIASHARHVEMPILLERVLLALGLGIVSVVVFVDGLSLTMKSLYVLDIWTAIKSTILKPLLLLLR